MIIAYHRPKSIDEARAILARPGTVPLGGGTQLAHTTADSVEAVDLQGLHLNLVKEAGRTLEIGATVTLQQLSDHELCPEPLRRAIRIEAPFNIRNAATVAGTIVACDGRSAFVAALLALDAKLTMDNAQSPIALGLGDFLPLRPRVLITAIALPIQTKFALEYVARTPLDKPLACVALARWPSGRTRLAVCGFGKSPLLAMDGTEAEGVEAAARNAFHEADDEWGSAEYRMDVAATLATRCLQVMQS